MKRVSLKSSIKGQLQLSMDKYGINITELSPKEYKELYDRETVFAAAK